MIAAVQLRQRCIMTTLDPDTVQQDVEVLKRIHRELDGYLRPRPSRREAGAGAGG